MVRALAYPRQGEERTEFGSPLTPDHYLFVERVKATPFFAISSGSEQIAPLESGVRFLSRCKPCETKQIN